MTEINEAIYKEAMLTGKRNVTTTIRTGIFIWAEKKKIDITDLIEYGFKSLLNIRYDNKRLDDMEKEITVLKKNIQKYQTLLGEYRRKEIENVDKTKAQKSIAA